MPALVAIPEPGPAGRRRDLHAAPLVGWCGVRRAVLAFALAGVAAGLYGAYRWFYRWEPIEWEVID